ncbi:kinesin-like protein KIF19, partial [Athene noctua]|uniref:kinesin-like protein KIF19 n=1 Tax=Athene noctua TaxID=126797 RepID=UPI003EBF92C6
CSTGARSGGATQGWGVLRTGSAATCCLGTLRGDPVGTQPCSAWGHCVGILHRDIRGDLLHQLCPAWEPSSGILLGDLLGDLLHQPGPAQGPHLGTQFGVVRCCGRGTFTPAPSQVRQDPLSVAADLHGEIQRLRGQGDAKLGRPGQGKHRDIPYTQAQVWLRSARRELAGAHREQVALSHLLLRPQGTAGPAQHLLAPRARRGQRCSEEERGEPVGPSDGEGDSDAGDKRLEVPEPPDVAVAHKSVTVVVEKQDRLRQRKSQQHARRLEEALRPRSISGEQRELLALLRCPRRPELELPEPRSHTLLEGGLRHPPAVTAQRFGRHGALCALIIRQQQQLIADHRLSVPRPLEELYETYLRELAGDPGDTGTLRGMSLPKILPACGAETPLAWDSGQARSCGHPTPCHDSLPPLRPTGDRYGWAPTTTPPRGTAEGCPLPSSAPTPPCSRRPRGHSRWGLGGRRFQMWSSTKSVTAEATQHQSRIPGSTHPHPPAPGEEQGDGKRSLAHKKGGKEPGRREESLDGRRRSRRSRSQLRDPLRGSRRPPGAPRDAEPPRAHRAGGGAGTQHPGIPQSAAWSKAAPSDSCQLPTTPGQGQHPRHDCITGTGARASSKDDGVTGAEPSGRGAGPRAKPTG